MDLDDKVINLDIVIQYLLSSQLSLCNIILSTVVYIRRQNTQLRNNQNIQLPKSIKESESIDQNVLFESRENVIYNIL